MDKSTFLRLVNTSWRMRLFLLRKLPSAWFMGISVVQCDGIGCTVSLPYRWQSQNPFRSIYFAAQCAAGELSTGLLAMTALQDRPHISMLVTRIEAEFLKKSAAKLLFTCTAGTEVDATVAETLKREDAQTLRMESTGCLPDGTVAARVWITWSFKRK